MGDITGLDCGCKDNANQDYKKNKFVLNFKKPLTLFTQTK